ncbi:MAG: c-type cytochrome [Rhodothermales bacterium]
MKTYVRRFISPFLFIAVIGSSGFSCSQGAEQLIQEAPKFEVKTVSPKGFSFTDKNSIHHKSDGSLIVAVEDTITSVPPLQTLSVEEQQAHFLLPPGYKIEPVLTEPVIKEPAAIAFDGNGRMFVLELRSYMQDIDATDELQPMSRISMHEDLDNDGVYETNYVFVDSLIFPRFVMPFGINSILTMESNEDDVFKYTDTDGDGTADEKTLFTTNFGKSGNVEHQQAFLYTGMDNWMYSTYNRFRIRWTPNGVLREETGSNRAQWGVTQDDEGKIWFQGGASGVPSYFQFPIVYGNFNVKEPFEEGFRVPYSVSGVGDYQPGPIASRADGTLNQVTGSAGNDIVRGHRMPDDLKGHYIYGEPVGRMIRRIEPVNTEGLTQLRNVYQDQESEFIRSTDPLFRPVDLATAPDGSLYIVDMYRGIIQQGNWVQDGTFLRAKVKQYAFDKVFGNGRIWRLTHESMDRDPRTPRMHDETPAQWVAHLTHPNGTWRDAAQQLLVLTQDRSVVPALEQMVRTSENELARYHAMWTLEGLAALDAQLVRDLLKDANPKMRIQALRASETLYKMGDRSFAADYAMLAVDENTDVAIQAMLTLSLMDPLNKVEAIQSGLAASTAAGVQFVGDKILNPTVFESNDLAFSDIERKRILEGAEIFDELCSQCHGNSGLGTPVGNGQIMAPPLTNSERVQGHESYVIKTLLHGLRGPIQEISYPGEVMIGMGEQTDEWIASVASYIRTNLSNEAGPVSPEAVAHYRSETAGQEAPYTFDALITSVPRPLRFDRDSWQVSASHAITNRVGGTGSAIGAFSFEGWTTGTAQQPGMWFEIGFPEAVTLAQIKFKSPSQRRGRGADAPPPFQTSPRQYSVLTSMDGTVWSDPIVEGEGSGDEVTIDFAPAKAKYFRITQNGEDPEGAPWAIREMKVFGMMNE